ICQAQYMFNGWKFRGAPSGSNGLAAIVVFYAKLDEASGTVVDSKSGNNGTATSVTYSATGKLNTGISTTGEGIDFGDPAALRLSNKGSISLWVNFSDVSLVPLILGKINYATDRSGYSLGLAGSQFFFELASSTAVNQLTVTGTLAVSTWYHVVITWDGSIIKSYVNGAFQNSVSQ